MGEIVEGTCVYDHEKTERGLSKVAGLQGVVQTGEWVGLGGVTCGSDRGLLF